MSVKKIEEIMSDFVSNMPEALRELPEKSRKKIQEHVADTLSRMDVVTREEFEVQQAILVKTREKLDLLEARLANKDIANK